MIFFSECKNRCGFNFLMFFSWCPTGTFALVSWERKLQMMRGILKNRTLCRISCFRSIPPTNSFTKKNLGGFSLNCCITCFQKRRGKALKKSIKSEKPTFWITLLCLLFPFIVFYYFCCTVLLLLSLSANWEWQKGGFEDLKQQL